MEKTVLTSLEGISLKKIETPCYLYFDQELAQNIKQFLSFRENNIKTFYSVKANNYIPLISELINNGFGFDVASREEIEFITNLGAKPDKISFSAPSKKMGDIEYAYSIGIKYFAFDSEEEIKKILRVSRRTILFARIASFSKDAVFNLSSKFGMNEKYFKYLVRRASAKKWPIEGISFHVGSQNISHTAWKHALEHACDLIDFAKKFGIHIKFINIGGGIPAPYKKHLKDVSFYLEEIIAAINRARKRHPATEFFAEPGRALCANTMALITRVIDVKPYKNPPLLIVDTGVFNGIIEPLEGFEYPVINLRKSQKTNTKKFFRISGFSCEGYDVIAQKVLMDSGTRNGDLLAFLHAGAYTFVYENFHMVGYPMIHRVSSAIPIIGTNPRASSGLLFPISKIREPARSERIIRAGQTIAFASSSPASKLLIAPSVSTRPNRNGKPCRAKADENKTIRKLVLDNMS